MYGTCGDDALQLQYLLYLSSWLFAQAFGQHSDIQCCSIFPTLRVAVVSSIVVADSLLYIALSLFSFLPKRNFMGFRIILRRVSTLAGLISRYLHASKYYCHMWAGAHPLLIVIDSLLLAAIMRLFISEDYRKNNRGGKYLFSRGGREGAGAGASRGVETRGIHILHPSAAALHSCCSFFIASPSTRARRLYAYTATAVAHTRVQYIHQEGQTRRCGLHRCTNDHAKVSFKCDPPPRQNRPTDMLISNAIQASLG